MNKKRTSEEDTDAFSLMKFEYEIIEDYREMHSKRIVSWGQIFLPASLLVMAVFIGELFSIIGTASVLTVVAYLHTSSILVFVLILYWTKITSRSDASIVGQYRRMLELEEQLGEIHFFSAYYFNNLRRKHHFLFQHKDVLAFLKKTTGLSDDLERMSYQTFREKVADETDGKAQTYLLQVWDKYGNESVGGRGHEWHLLTAVSFIAAYVGFVLFIALGLVFGWWNIT